MGSLMGHLIPGSFFFFYGLVWSVLSFWLHLTSSSKSTNPQNKSKTRQTRSSSALTFGNFKREIELSRKSYIPQPHFRTVPMEPIIKMALSFVGIIVELFFVVKDDHLKFKRVTSSDFGRVQHITMYSGFFLSGLIDLIALFVKVPRNTTKLFLALAYIIEGLLFWFHQGEDDGVLLYMAHFLLVPAVMTCAVFSGLRMLSPVNLLINTGLSYGILLQGTWLVQVGLLIHRRQLWDFDSLDQSTFLVAMFSWHLMALFTLVFVLFVVMTAVIKSNSMCHRSSRARRHWLPSLLPTVADDNSEEGEQLIKIEEKPPQFAETAT